MKSKEIIDSFDHNDDFLVRLINKYPYNPSELKRAVFGAKHCAVELVNGNIGICSTLGIVLSHDSGVLRLSDYSRVEHRIVLNAWVNAKANYTLPISGNGDIFDVIDFSSYSNTVMIGYFGSLYEKFRQSGTPVTVFDLDSADKPVAPIEYQKEYLGRADAVVLTATSISNNTFNPIIANTAENVDVFILGPSTTLDRDLLNHPKVRGLFGSRFSQFDDQILDMIELVMETRSMLPFINKVYIYKKKVNS